MPVKWHEERVRRTYFGRDSEGVFTQPPLIPLASKWIVRATGIWVHAWALGESNSPTETADSSVSLTPMCWEGVEPVSSWTNPEAIQRAIYSGDVWTSPIFLTPESTTTGRLSAVSAFVDLPATGAAYPSLVMMFNGVSENDGAQISKPLWAAAKLLYRVEH